MPGLVPGIHVFGSYASKTWMAGTSPAMTEENAQPRYAVMLIFQRPSLESC
jgi:hypothetical protein